MGLRLPQSGSQGPYYGSRGSALSRGNQRIDIVNGGPNRDERARLRLSCFPPETPAPTEPRPSVTRFFQHFFLPSQPYHSNDLQLPDPLFPETALVGQSSSPCRPVCNKLSVLVGGRLRVVSGDRGRMVYAPRRQGAEAPCLGMVAFLLRPTLTSRVGQARGLSPLSGDGPNSPETDIDITRRVGKGLKSVVWRWAGFLWSG